MTISRAKMESLAAHGDERAKAFLSALDSSGGSASGAARLLMAVANVDPDKVVRQERRNLDSIKNRLMTIRGEACEVCTTIMPARSLIHAHHVLPIVNGGTDEDRNIVLLCPNCHAIAHWRYREMGSQPQSTAEFFAVMLEGDAAQEQMRRSFAA